MDNRNLSTKEKAQIEENRRMTMAQRSNKEQKVTQEIDDVNEVNEQGLT